MNNTNKVRLGFIMAVTAFCITIEMSQTQGFCELNPVMGFLFKECTTYHIVLAYALMWSAVLAMYDYAKDVVSVYHLNYVANVILLMGFFDLLHDLISIIVYMSRV